MRGRRIPYHAVFIAFTAMACTSVADGQVTALHIVSQPAPAGALPGYVVNDLLIDFAGEYVGSQMIVELTSGEIYQDILGGKIAPTYCDGCPFTIEWDTFVANGGPGVQSTVGNFGLGGAAIGIDSDFMGQGPQRAPQFGETVIDQSWNPASDNEILDQTRFMVARVTLSNDANGLLQYYAGAGQVLGVGQPGRIAMLPIRNGAVIPEPSTLGLLTVGLAIAMAARGCARSRWLCAGQTRPPWRR